MAEIKQRNGVWQAVFWVNGKRIRESTRVRVGTTKEERRANEKLAHQTAQAMEATQKGLPVDKAVAAVRAAAETCGAFNAVPSVREFFNGFQPTAGESSAKNCRRAANVFLKWLGTDADKRIDNLTYDQCRAFIIQQLKEVSKGTVTQYHTYIKQILAAAQDIHRYTSSNPMRPVKVTQEFKRLFPDSATDAVEKVPFTPQELYRLMTEAPKPWNDIVAVCFYLGGLRMSDVCLLKWDNVKWEKHLIVFTEKKTKKDRQQPIIAPLEQLLKRMRSEQDSREEYLFPAQAHKYLGHCNGALSTSFTAILQAMNINRVPTSTSKNSGRKRHVSEKTFHSIRHTAVTMLRSNPTFTSDVVRDVVGHDSEEVERAYFHGNTTIRRHALEALAANVEDISNMPTYSKKTA